VVVGLVGAAGAVGIGRRINWKPGVALDAGKPDGSLAGVPAKRS